MWIRLRRWLRYRGGVWLAIHGGECGSRRAAASVRDRERRLAGIYRR